MYYPVRFISPVSSFSPSLEELRTTKSLAWNWDFLKKVFRALKVSGHLKIGRPWSLSYNFSRNIAQSIESLVHDLYRLHFQGEIEKDERKRQSEGRTKQPLKRRMEIQWKVTREAEIDTWTREYGVTVGRGGIGASVGRLPMLAYLCGTPVLARRCSIFRTTNKKRATTSPFRPHS